MSGVFLGVIQIPSIFQVFLGVIIFFQVLPPCWFTCRVTPWAYPYPVGRPYGLWISSLTLLWSNI